MLPNELLISQQARDLGNQLIKEMNINRSYGLANFLGVNTCYDNHQAVLIWTFQLLEREPALNELAEIKKYFLLGGVSKSMLTLNEAIIDVKKG
ncbi:hypothetical protein [Acinetobacter baumannii]|uniref:hypothetical protein n=5 Tax=Acinetobacter TaxID=469 RepID=UPI0021F30EE2|nr:hypothetical protein [Acinetobacter baumannii]